MEINKKLLHLNANQMKNIDFLKRKLKLLMKFKNLLDIKIIPSIWMKISL
jgi:hypothetical protein